MLGLHPAPVACLFHLGGEVDSVYLAAISVSTRWRSRYQVEASIYIVKHPNPCRLLFTASQQNKGFLSKNLPLSPIKIKPKKNTKLGKKETAEKSE